MIKKPSIRYQPTKGFTLLELLIAMALAAMVVAVLASGLSITLKDWNSNTKQLEDQLDNSLALLQIEQALIGAYPHLYQDRKKLKKYILFEGKQKKIVWVSSVSPDRTPGLTAWELKPGKDDKGLLLRIAPAFADDPAKRLKKTEPIHLFPDYQVRFEYLEIKPQKRYMEQEKTEWKKKWSAKKRQSLPFAVRMVLRDGNQGKPVAEIIAPIMAQEHFTLKPKILR